MRHLEHGIDADVIERSHCGYVERRGERHPQRRRAAEAQVIVDRLVASDGRLETRGDVQQGRRRRVAPLEGGRVEERLQRRSRLPQGERHVHLPRAFLAEVGAPDQDEDGPASGVDRDHGAVARVVVGDAAKMRPHRAVRLALQGGVEGGLDHQTGPTNEIGANPGQLFLHHQREVGGERGLGFAHEGERRAGSFSRLRRRDRSRRDEPVEHVALPGLCRSEPVRLPVDPRQLRKAGQVARLGEVEVAGADAEVEAGGSLDAVGAATVVDVIQVGLEDLVFRIASLQLQGDQALSRLSRQRRQVGTRQVEPPCDLLGNRRGAPRPRPLHRPRHPGHVPGREGRRPGESRSVDPLLQWWRRRREGRCLREQRGCAHPPRRPEPVGRRGGRPSAFRGVGSS